MIFLKNIKKAYIHRSNASFIKYLRKKGITIGNNCVFRSPISTTIDKTRPTLISIGNNVDMNRNFTIMSHDYTNSVFIRKHNDFINSSGKVTIGNNIYFGLNCTVLKGVTIGDNCIIGAHSLVTKDIPANSVAAGVPAKVICSIDDYYSKRKKEAIEEAFEYARSIQEVQKRRPVPSDFQEEFIYFVKGCDVDKYPKHRIEDLLEDAFPIWKETHKPKFDSFDDFLSAAGIK